MAKTILFNKPFGVLSQFTEASTATSPSETLSDYVDTPGVYPAGRLDKDSEGLLVLTSDGKSQNRISNPRHKLPKTYLVQVEGIPTNAQIRTLCKGVHLKDSLTAAAKVEMVDQPDWLWPRNPPIRIRKTVPDRWLKIILTEGRNRQVRRMTAAIGCPTLRLVRYQIGNWTIDNLANGEWRAI